MSYAAHGDLHNPDGMTSFSSAGPTSDHRIHFDVVAPGSVVLSAPSRAIPDEGLEQYFWNFGHPTSDDTLFMAGTSVATPAVTRCVTALILL
jgi:serine protease AprX